MGQCGAIPCLSLSELGHELSNEEAAHRPRPSTDGLTLREELRKFRELGSSSPLVKAAGSDLWSTSCDLVEALMLGIVSHVPDAIGRTELRRSGELAIHIHMRRELKGEFATRSRVGGELYVGPEVIFSLRPCVPPSEDSRSGADAASFQLGVSGLEMRPLEECVRIRNTLMDLLGEDNLTRQSVYSWWEEHIHEFPPDRSKIRRIYMSFLGLKTAGLPRWARAKGMWGYFMAQTEVYEAFELQRDARSATGATIKLVLRPPSGPEQAAGLERQRSLCQEVLRQDRAVAQRLAASSMNYVAMVHAHTIGMCGGCPRKIVKLFSAAKTWGPGSDSWQRSDATWLCVDSKDMLGRTISEQGRILWHWRQGNRWIAPGMGEEQVGPRLDEVPSTLSPKKIGTIDEKSQQQALIPCMLLGALLIALTTMRSSLPEMLFFLIGTA